MMMMNLKLVKGKISYEADFAVNEDEPDGGVNYRIKVIKELVEPFEGKNIYIGSRKVTFLFCAIFKTIVEDGPCIH